MKFIKNNQITGYARENSQLSAQKIHLITTNQPIIKKLQYGPGNVNDAKYC